MKTTLKTEGSLKTDGTYIEDGFFLPVKPCPVCKIVNKEEEQDDDTKYPPTEFIQHLMKKHSKRNLAELIQEATLNDLFEEELQTFYV